MPVSKELIQKLMDVVGVSSVFTDIETRKRYGHDETEDFCFPPAVVVKPNNVEEVSAVMKLANEFYTPVVPIGGQTGLSGGALSVLEGIGLSTERLNKIIEIDEKNLQIITEPAVVTQVLREAVAEKGLFYPVDPSSMGSCFIGGNIAENSGGARAVKYGLTKDYVLNLEVVLPNGEIIWTGANTLKNSTGYNLTQLMIGSEGTLGIVTKAVLKLLPKVSFNILMLVPFYKADEACEAVSAIFRAGIVPSALEFMERDAIDWSLKYIEGIAIEVKTDHQAHLLIEVDGNYPEILMLEAEKIMRVLENFQIDEILFADTEDQKKALWKMRRGIAEAVKANSIYKEEDTVVPRYELPKLLKGIKKIGAKYGFQSVCYGHAGDGNLHVNIIKGYLTDAQWTEEVPKGIREIFELTISLKGTLSGEHGIGWVQKNYMDMAFSKMHLELMEQIKYIFDPNNVMNPGKILPDKF
ncbi:FAD-binding oxidoreductase [Flavobacterium columnare]|uniref:FAD-binding protein n=1 Tax=Flavobacterium columnare TaxID=996 RepID=A0AAI8CFE8_9FLAO|nr:FAD-linked oxidase C-terminal domain-containing protein [Flavobacterium columnare]AMO19168.1 FAD-binding protein [Flavobacterium columnare]AUX17105.1 dehydrogenase [Flavobacterium columnare]QOG56114.1 FAD-binding protein [Flavobacterium columnare]QOG58837.1 FAD-binding protein [Flavobacterium columnare]QOG61559.1 FAD-binding protein [Flavobacterium columnare]